MQKLQIYESHLQFWASLRLLWSYGRACGSSLLEQQPLIRKTKPSRCLPPPRLRTHSRMLIQLSQSKAASKSSPAMEQVRRWLSRSSKARQRMDYGVQKKVDTRVNLLGNRLVLIAAKDAKIDPVTIGPDFDLAKLAGDGRVATGDVRDVPVGLYAKAALEWLGAWAAVEPKMVMAGNVRLALSLVARGEAPLGIVYETDANIEPAVKVIGVFPDNTDDPIIYPVALTANAKSDAVQYLSFLRIQTAKSVFEKYGFNFLD